MVGMVKVGMPGITASSGIDSSHSNVTTLAYLPVSKELSQPSDQTSAIRLELLL
jgi:hypothetical protein